MTKKIYQLSNEEINEFINKLLPVKKMEKDKYGEVFTNPILIQKMLDLFPSHIWTNPHLKWLDPCVGAGFFMIMVYQRLMKGLKRWQPNIKKRSEHIISKMLFMVEINNTNCNICKDLFGSTIQLVCSDFLSDFTFANCPDLLFDCIIGNPPFQDDYGKNGDGKRIQGGKSKLYERIFLKAYNLLNKNGYLSFIVPDNLFSGNGSESYHVLLQNNISFVSFNPSNQSFFPGIQQVICYFMLHKKKTKELTTIETSDTNKIHIQLENRPVNPIRNWTLSTENLIKKYVSNERNNVRYNRGKPVLAYKGTKYEIVYSPEKRIGTNKLELAVGYGEKKVILFAMNTNYSFLMDYSGKLGAGPNTFIIPFNTYLQGKKLENFFNSNEYKILTLATQTTRQYLKIAFIEYLKLTKIMASNNTKKRRILKKQNNTKKYL